MVTVSTRRLLIVLVACSFLVVGSGWLAELFHRIDGGPPVPLFILDRVSFSGEANIPAWYSSVLLFVASFLLLAAYLTGPSDESGRDRRWAALAAVFLFLSMDEAVAWHETTGNIMHKLGVEGGFLRYPWWIVGALFVGTLAIWYLPWLLSLERRTRAWFAVSAAVFLAGALGMEPVSGQLADMSGKNTVLYASVRALSDLLEMLGASLFIFGLLEYLRTHAGRIVIDLEPADAAGFRQVDLGPADLDPEDVKASA